MGHNDVLLNESVNENLPRIEARMHNQRYVSGTQGGARSESHNINNVYVYNVCLYACVCLYVCACAYMFEFNSTENLSPTA